MTQTYDRKIIFISYDKHGIEAFEHVKNVSKWMLRNKEYFPKEKGK